MGIREYETVFIMRPDASDEHIDRLAARLDKVIEDFKATLLIRENWGKKKLAYDIEKHAKGTYIFYNYLGVGGLVHEMERNLKIDENVIRYMTIKVDEDVDAEARVKSASERPKVAPQTLDDDDDMPPHMHGRGRGKPRRFADDDEEEMDEQDY